MITLVDLVVEHKAEVGDGLNFKTPFWSAVVTVLSPPCRGGTKTVKICKDKWKRLRSTYDTIKNICNTSGFMYLEGAGADIRDVNEDIYVK
ncbi:hypothetical protein PAXRUDRAFT_799648 [Paxillus rubicundulus Ve08.2h10]|uniref:Myb/SANT-like domain-containing protein n=1 Tax=Paxillus rubicundulus Ve08.2h10 TaxID=930991 RepID=A0A0D0D3F3_9AGAM|nr:hypothetical protein PAXRUDRAFT_799648 [Paxillus rubicundulus Ve08.2h10]